MADRRRRVAWTDEAHLALDEILDYIAQESPQNACTLLERAIKASAELGTMAERGRVVPEQDDPDTREIFVGRYRLLYEVRPSEVVIIGLLHGARDFGKWQGEH
jgi:plasmid stabilization system protein ParE